MPNSGTPAVHHALDGGNGIGAGRLGIARSVRQHHAVGLMWRSTSSVVALAGTTVMSAPWPASRPQYVALDAIIDDHGLPARLGFVLITDAPKPRRLTPFEALVRSHFLRQIEPFQSRKALGLFQQRRLVDDTIADSAVRHALFADQRSEGAGVDPRQGRDVVLLQPAVQRHQAAIVGGMLGIGAHDQPAHRRRQRLNVFVIGADHADIRKGEGDDLPGIGGIGEEILDSRSWRC